MVHVHDRADRRRQAAQDEIGVVQTAEVERDALQTARPDEGAPATCLRAAVRVDARGEDGQGDPDHHGVAHQGRQRRRHPGEDPEDLLSHTRDDVGADREQEARASGAVHRESADSKHEHERHAPGSSDFASIQAAAAKRSRMMTAGEISESGTGAPPRASEARQMSALEPRTARIAS